MKKSYILMAILCLMTVSLLCACGGETAAETPTDKIETPTDTTPSGTTAPAETFEGPVLVVSVGQSADISIAKSIMSKVGVDYTIYEEDTSLDGFKSAMLVPGVSVKGLGAAGISVEDELAATSDLLGKLEDAGIKILVAHLGGSSRRDELTDQFLDAVLPSADYICALEEGNKDGKFTDLASANNIPCSMDADIVSVVGTISALYGAAK